MKTESKRRFYLFAAAFIVIAAAWGFKKWQEAKLYNDARLQAQREADEVPQVKLFKIKPQALSGSLKRIGTIRARAETNLQFGASGRLLKFGVEKGQFVKKGAVIASLDQEEAKNMLTTAEVEFKRASEKYFEDRIIDRLEFERAKARYNQARLEAGKTVIHAPHDGYLVEKWINTGEQVDGGTVIGKLMDKTQVYIDMDLSEDDIKSLKKGQKVSVAVDAVPDFKSEGEVSSITPYLKGDTRSFNVKVNVSQDPKESLSPGMFARCTVRRYEKPDALVIPLDAGAEMQEKTVKVFTVGDDNIAKAKAVSILFQDEGLLEVEGLLAGESVILHPPTSLQDGAKVNVIGVFDPASAESPVVGRAGN